MNTQVRLFFFHDGILEETDSPNNDGCTYLIVTIVNGIPVGSVISLCKDGELQIR